MAAQVNDFLSPSARALLNAITQIEHNEQLNLFQKDPSIERLDKMVKTHKSSLSEGLRARIEHLVKLGNITLITQSDLMDLAEEVWLENTSSLSKTELKLLGATFNIPGAPLKSVSTMARLSYSQTRRASKRLRDSEVLQIKAVPNCEKLGFTRVLLELEAPTSIVTGPYVEKVLFTESPKRTTYQVLKLPTKELDNVLVRSLRNTAESATAWRLSPGSMAFNGLWYDSRQSQWDPDLFHWRLVLRNSFGNKLTMSSPPKSELLAPKLIQTTLNVMDVMYTDYEMTANDIALKLNISSATAFRIRNIIMSENYIVPRPQVNLLGLEDRVIGLLDESAAGELISSWDLLPSGYVSMVQNLEDSSDRRALLLGVLPSGTGRELVKALEVEMSRVRTSLFHIVSSGIDEHINLKRLYDRRAGSWKFSSDFFDAPTYATVRREADRKGKLPSDLA